MSNFNIKVGDKVYYPRGSSKILTTKKNSCDAYPLVVKDDIGTVSLTSGGKRFTVDSNPSIFPATQEWYEKLVQIYPNLEPPAKRKETKEVIQAMFDYGWERVPCFTINSILSSKDFITKIDSDGNFVGRSVWSKAVPFDPKTGKAIIDFVDGKVVLEG